MNTLYEAWIKRSSRTIEEPIVVDVDPNDKSKGQKPSTRKVELEGEELAPIVNEETGEVFQSENVEEVKTVARQHLKEDGVERIFIREVRTVSELVPEVQQTS